VPRMAPRLLKQFPDLTIVHQCGARNYDATAQLYAGSTRWDRVTVMRYLDAMVAEIAASDLILCRSGASTVAELAAAGRASILVPFAAAADDHQRKNAEVFVAAGAAAMILESELTPDRVLAEVTELLASPEARQRMAEAARTLAHVNAASDIAQICLGLTKTQPVG
jgi:UDP-N-acetylglucosamine--N-acetylmuramyl-(pentapeptide) pyrophosphoryl-undecaprenol N-acetylglucosamine transferase